MMTSSHNTYAGDRYDNDSYDYSNNFDVHSMIYQPANMGSPAVLPIRANYSLGFMSKHQPYIVLSCTL